MKSRQKDDWYPTPDSATKALLAVEVFDPYIWEPAAGDGALAEVLKADDYGVIASDLNDYGYCESGIDFLMATDLACNSLITNPPYKLAEEFILHAIALGAAKHAWLLRLSFLESLGRFQRLFRAHPPARIHVFSKRLTIWRGDFVNAARNEPMPGTGTTAYAWFVWEKDFSGSPQLGWL